MTSWPKKCVAPFFDDIHISKRKLVYKRKAMGIIVYKKRAMGKKLGSIYLQATCEICPSPCSEFREIVQKFKDSPTP